MDASGKEIVKPTFKAVGAFSELGVAIVQMENGKAGFFASDGKLLIEAKYEALGNFVKVR